MWYNIHKGHTLQVCSWRNFYICVFPGHHHLGQDLAHSSIPWSFSIHYHPPPRRVIAVLTSNNRLVVPILELHINRIIQYIFLCIWPFSLIVTSVSFIHIVLLLIALLVISFYVLLFCMFLPCLPFFPCIPLKVQSIFYIWHILAYSGHLKLLHECMLTRFQFILLLSKSKLCPLSLVALHV